MKADVGCRPFLLGKKTSEIGGQDIGTNQYVDFKQGIFSLQFSDHFHPAHFQLCKRTGVNAVLHSAERPQYKNTEDINITVRCETRSQNPKEGSRKNEAGILVRKG